MEQVRAQLDREEPDYDHAATLGPEALPHLLHLVEADDPGLATNATYLAGFIDVDTSAAVIERAVRSHHRVVQAAAAGALRAVTTVPPTLAIELLGDHDTGVRNLTLKALQAKRPVSVHATVHEVARNDPEMAVRRRASQSVDLLPYPAAEARPKRHTRSERSRPSPRSS